MLGNLRTVARTLNLPYFPITPTFPWLGPLGLIPLPSKWIIEFGEPIETSSFGDGAAEDPMLVFDLTDQVRSPSSSRCMCFYVSAGLHSADPAGNAGGRSVRPSG
jgi:hypothetical protein